MDGELIDELMSSEGKYLARNFNSEICVYCLYNTLAIGPSCDLTYFGIFTLNGCCLWSLIVGQKSRSQENLNGLFQLLKKYGLC